MKVKTHVKAGTGSCGNPCNPCCGGNTNNNTNNNEATGINVEVGPLIGGG